MKLRLFITIILVVFFLLTGNAFAATYYVSTTGDNYDAGTEVAPWLTLTYAKSHINSGDTVIVRGGTYKERLIINVPNVTFKNFTGEEPIIDGEWIRPVAPDVPRCYGALLEINAARVTVDGFEVRNSTGVGIKIYGSGTDDVILRNCKSHDTYYLALQVSHYTDNALIEDCEFYRGGKVWYLHHDRTNWGDPANVNCTTNATGTILRRCIIRDSWNEGILFGGGSGHTLEYSLIYGNPKLQFYDCNSKNNTVRYNLIYGTNTNDNGESGRGPGIWISNEVWVGQPDVYSNTKIYGNFVANTTYNFWIGGGEDFKVHNVIAYNNTFVEANKNAVVVNSQTGSGHIFKNNIVWQTNGVIAYALSGKVTADYNLWSREPDVDIQGDNDLKYAAPQLTKTTGWTTLSGGSLSGIEFGLKSTSPAVDAGKFLDTVYSKIPDCNVSVWSGAVKLRNQTDQGSGWEIGADVHVVDTDPEGEIQSPKILTIKTSSK